MALTMKNISARSVNTLANGLFGIQNRLKMTCEAIAVNVLRRAR